MNRTDRPFNKKMQEKLVVLFLLVLLAFVGLSIKLISITRDNGERYKKQVLSQQQYESTTIPFKRGDILDSKGNKLATSEKVYNLIIDSKMMLRKEESLNATMSALNECFPDFPEADVRNYIAQNPASQYYVALRQLNYDEISDFVDIQNDRTANPDVAGVWFEEEYKRIYPNNTLACDVIGFTGKDNVGSTALTICPNNILDLA